MLDLSLYVKSNIEIFQNEKDFLKLKFCPPVDFPYFLGHFPEYPVLPAVAVLDVTVYLVGEYMNLENQNKLQVHIQKLDQLKIKSGIQPEQKVIIEISKQKNIISTIWSDNLNQTLCQAQFLIQ